MIDETAPPNERRSAARHGSAAEVLGRIPATLLLERLPIPALAVDSNGLIAFANQALLELLDHDREALTGQPVQVIAPGLPSSGTEAVQELRMLAGQTILLRGGIDEVRHAMVSASLLLRHDEDFTVVLLEDVTERRWHGQRI